MSLNSPLLVPTHSAPVRSAAGTSTDSSERATTTPKGGRASMPQDRRPLDPERARQMAYLGIAQRRTWKIRALIEQCPPLSAEQVDLLHRTLEAHPRQGE